MSTPSGKLTIMEIVAKFPSIVSIVNRGVDAVKAAQVDGAVSGEEVGKILAAIGPDLGKLIDELIADSKS